MSKVEAYKTDTATRADGTTVFYRTGKGSHRHASYYCANSKRDLMTGDPEVIDPAEAIGWAPCLDCCTDADVLQAQAVSEAKAAAQCRNSGVAQPNRINSTCRDCGKAGKVNRSTGKLRAHTPAA